MLELPVPAKSLSKWVPHRPPMVWIDEVVEVTETTGRCLVHLKKDAHYMDESGLRPSSLIEFLAQAFAFSAAYREVSVRGDFQSGKGYLVGFRDVVIHSKSLPNVGTLEVSVELKRQLGPIALCLGMVRVGSSLEPLCVGSLKIYVEGSLSSS